MTSPHSNGSDVVAIVPNETSPLLNRIEENRSSIDPGGTETANDITTDSETEAAKNASTNLKMKVMWTMPALAIGIFLSAADQTIVVATYGKIGSEMQALNSTSWIATAYFLTLTSFQPLYGKLSDIFGRKSALLFSFGIFGLGCLFCGLARGMKELIAARAFAGIGGGGMTTVVAILLSDVIPLRDRGAWQGYNNIVFATGAGVGAPLGGYIADYMGWRWSFLLQVPLTMAAFLNVYLALALPESDGSNLKQKVKRVDFTGALVLICAVFTLLLGLDQGSNGSWQSPVALGCLCGSLLLFVVFVLVETRFASEPFAPSHVIFDRSLLACLLCNFFSFGGWLALIYYVPLYWQAGQNLTATQAGSRLLPGIVAGVSGSLFAGLVMKRTGRYYWLTVFCYTLFTIGIIPVILFTGLVLDSLWGIWLGLILCGFSNGIGGTSTLVALISNASPKDQSVAIACLYLFRSLGSAVGISLSATVVQQSLRIRLREALKSNMDVDNIVEHVRQSLYYINTLDPQVQRLVRRCYTAATRGSFILNLGIVAGALCASLFIKEKRLI